MASPIIVTGDFNSLSISLTINGVAAVIDLAAVVKARLVSSGHTQDYSDAVEQANDSSAIDGTPANWAAGRVVVNFAKADTASIEYQGPALLEIQVEEDSKPRTWFVPVKIVTGRIA